MQTKVLENQEIQLIKSEWMDKGALEASIDNFINYNKEQHIEIRAVTDDNNNFLALFEIRQVLSSQIKSMDLLLSPDLDISNGNDYNNVLKSLELSINVISYVFNEVAEHAKKNLKVKIYNEDTSVRTILINFAKALKDKDDNYNIKVYSNWIELSYNN